MSRVLVVAAHPDDEILGAGATMSRLVRRGNEVHVLIMGQGEASRADSPKLDSSRAIQELELCAKSASEIIGATSIEFARLPDNSMDSMTLLSIVKIIEKRIEVLKPSTVLTHSISDLNVDHHLIARAVVTATRPLPGRDIALVLSFEVPSSTEWAFGSLGTFEPNEFFEVSDDDIHRKMRALEAYSSEMRSSPHPRSLDHSLNLARVRGATVGVEFAEAFQIVRSIRYLPSNFGEA